MNKVLRFIFFNCFIRLIINLILGVNVRNKDRLPKEGPAIIVANHNSHLDTMVIMYLMLDRLAIVQPVAAVDYFLKNKLLAWFSLKIIGILPLQRRPTGREDILQPIYTALEENKILILFPEGSRGNPEQFQKMKTGIARIAEKMPHVPVIPIYFYGLGKALPKGELLLVPFFCDAYVGEPIRWNSDRKTYMESLQSNFDALVEEASVTEWE
ncbi:MAG: 1-acyl-sn-glycerol-3-phosphate acyltransferase [Fibrobacterales bacterium]